MTSDVFEEVEHTADWAIRVRGRGLEDLFVNAALGMATLMADVEAVKPNVERRVELDECDTETLLVSWLSELLWFNEDTGAVFTRFQIHTLTSTHLKATAWGGPVSSQWKHIKAVTFYDLQIIETDEGLTVTVVFDV